MAMSIVQGGPGLPILSPVVYDYISSGHYCPEKIVDSDVPNLDVQLLLAQVYMNYIL